MTESVLSEIDFKSCIEQCADYRTFGKFKYLCEISVPDNEFGAFLKWLNLCESCRLDFVFFIINRYDGFKTLYGFSNFEIQMTKNMKILDFDLENEDILYFRFCEWHKESSSVIMSVTFLNKFRQLNKGANIKRISDNIFVNKTKKQ